MAASYTNSVAILFDPLERPIDLLSFRDVPFAQAVEKFDPVFIRSLIEPIRVLLNLSLFLLDMSQGHGDLLSPPREFVDLLSRSYCVHRRHLQLKP
jgi:hypothetical protein